MSGLRSLIVILISLILDCIPPAQFHQRISFFDPSSSCFRCNHSCCLFCHCSGWGFSICSGPGGLGCPGFGRGFCCDRGGSSSRGSPFVRCLRFDCNCCFCSWTGCALCCLLGGFVKKLLKMVLFLEE